MLSLFKNIAPIPMPLAQEDHYHIHPDKIAEEIARGTSVILTSNPRNPTGHFISGDELSNIQDICRDRATLILDEFYGGYNYTTDCDGTTISGAANVVDVNKDGMLHPLRKYTKKILTGSRRSSDRRPHKAFPSARLAHCLGCRPQGIHRCPRLRRFLPRRWRQRSLPRSRYPHA